MQKLLELVKNLFHSVHLKITFLRQFLTIFLCPFKYENVVSPTVKSRKLADFEGLVASQVTLLLLSSLLLPKHYKLCFQPEVNCKLGKTCKL